MKYTHFIAVLALPFMMAAALLTPMTPAYAADKVDCAILPDNICNAASKDSTTNVKNSGILLLLIWVMRILTAGVGIAAIGAIIYAGILYSSAGGSSEQVSKSKGIITNTVIGIVAYALMFVVLQWLIPGGVF